MVGLVGAVVAMCLAAVGGTAWWLWRKNRTSSDGLARLPAHSFVVARADPAQLSTFQPLADLRHNLEAPAAEASGREHRMSQQWHDLITRCGFDPLGRVRRVWLGADRDVLAGRSTTAWLATLDEDVAPEQGARCVAALADLLHATATTEDVGGRSVQSLSRQGATAAAADPSVHFARGAMVVSQRSYMPSALRIAYREDPGLEASAPIARMMQGFGAQYAFAMAGDVAAMRQQNASTATELVDRLVHENAGIPDLTLARQIVTAGLGFGVQNHGVELVVRAQLPSTDVARAFTAATQALWTARKPELSTLITEAQEGISATRAIAAISGGAEVTARFDRIDGAFVTARAALDQLRIAQDGANTVVTLTLTPPQVTALTEAARAAADMFRELTSGGAHPRRGGGGLPGLPPVEPPAQRGAGPGLGLPL